MTVPDQSGIPGPLRRNERALWISLYIAIPCLAASGLFGLWGAAITVLVCLGVALSFAATLVVRILQRNWMAAAEAAIGLLGVAAAMALAYGIAFVGFIGADDFADDLVIPDGVTVTKARTEWSDEPSERSDRLHTALYRSLERAGNGDASFTPDLGHLIALHRDTPALLERYLSASPSWRVVRMKSGERYAVARWYSGLKIFLSGAPFDARGAVLARSGERVVLHLMPDDGEPPQRRYSSCCLISAGELTVEICETSGDPERRITKAAIEFLNAEARALHNVDDGPKLWSLLGETAIRNGEPSFELYGVNGIYDTHLWVNPGEPGRIYLKAFEITRSTPLAAGPLSKGRLAEASSEWVGWSNDPQELFYSSTNIKIYEGPGKPYAARFEVWFDGDAGGADRKLFEKVFEIVGWER